MRTRLEFSGLIKRLRNYQAGSRGFRVPGWVLSLFCYQRKTLFSGLSGAAGNLADLLKICVPGWNSMVLRSYQARNSFLPEAPEDFRPGSLESQLTVM